ncbi:putative lipase [Chloropicon primus]|uniref:Putative lipase n=1 Tax=Chloropicon primus TaxID=1764295 RepID=A0A5B8MFJ9_9CHLO|nr:putative lipase [Chloropicon primus]UPQ98472.1 putative lipase [Chloropicon primus]|eukprot:QDZ19263.1 putative lipase [Chloropicon primus]
MLGTRSVFPAGTLVGGAVTAHPRRGRGSLRGQRGRRARSLAGEGPTTSEAASAELDPALALALAGHAFFAYKEPSQHVLKDRVGTDDSQTDLIFLDKNYVLRGFAGKLKVTSLAAHLPGAERKSEIFFALSIGGDVHSTASCKKLRGGEMHGWDEEHEFLLKSTGDNKLQVRVWKKRFLRPDELLGVAIVTPEAFAEGASLDLPLRGGSIEGSVLVETEYTSFDVLEDVQEHSSQMILDLIGIEQAPLLHMNFKPACFCTNEVTDTQAWIWWNEPAKEVLVSFRGTEQTQWKDLLTDVKVLPTSVNLEGVKNVHIFANSSEVMVHNGFLTAYLSIRNSILSQLRTLITPAGKEEEWTIFITGHSLGGALATILAYECAEADLGKIVVYTYGSPRVGNEAFVSDFHNLVDSSWRFSNVSDIIPTVPRFLGYKHVDNSVRICEDGTVQVLDDEKDVIGETHFTEILGVEDLPEVEELLQKELTLLSTLIDGTALQEHMEDNYLKNLLLLAAALRSSSDL